MSGATPISLLKSHAAAFRKELESQCSLHGGFNDPTNYATRWEAMFWTFCHNGNRSKAMKYKLRVESEFQRNLDTLMFPEDAEGPPTVFILESDVLDPNQDESARQIGELMKVFKQAADMWVNRADACRLWKPE